MAKLRKMLGSPDSPYIISLMRLIETQSKHTISCWAVSYAQQVMLPIYEKIGAEMLRSERSARRSAPFPHRPAHWGCVFMRQQLWPMTGLEPKKRMRYMNRLPQKNVRRCIRDFKKLQ